MIPSRLTKGRLFAEYCLFYRALLQKRPIILFRKKISLALDKWSQRVGGFLEIQGVCVCVLQQKEPNKIMQNHVTFAERAWWQQGSSPKDQVFPAERAWQKYASISKETERSSFDCRKSLRTVWLFCERKPNQVSFAKRTQQKRPDPIKAFWKREPEKSLFQNTRKENRVLLPKE